MTHGRVVWIPMTTVVFLLFSYVHSGSGDCKVGEYYDENLPGCDLCAPLCPRAGLEILPSDCVSFCKNEASIKSHTGSGGSQCKTGEYFDSNLPGCDRCDQMCERGLLEKLPSECKTFCSTMPSTSPPTREHGAETKSRSNQTIWVPVLLSGVIAVSIIGGIGLFFKCKLKIPKPCCWKENLKTPVQETQLDHGQDHSLHRNLLDQATVARQDECPV